MQNPFESGHIKNYLLLYASVIVIMILFFIASTLFHDIKKVEQKKFSTEVKDENISKLVNEEVVVKVDDNDSISQIRLLKKTY